MLNIFINPAKQIRLIFFSLISFRAICSNLLIPPVMTLEGIENFLAYFIPVALILLHNTSLIFIGKFVSLELKIIDLRLEPLPDIKTHAFFFYHFILLKNLICFFDLETKPIS